MRISGDGRSKEPKGAKEVRSRRPSAKDCQHGVRESNERIRNQGKGTAAWKATLEDGASARGQASQVKSKELGSENKNGTRNKRDGCDTIRVVSWRYQGSRL